MNYEFRNQTLNSTITYMDYIEYFVPNLFLIISLWNIYNIQYSIWTMSG